jgi:hypothetical protein
MVVTVYTLLVLLGVVVIIGMVMLGDLVEYLRVHHPLIWDAQGRPSRFFRSSGLSECSKWVLSRQYRKVNDPELLAKGDMMCLVTYLQFLLFFLLAIAYFVALYYTPQA